MKPIHKLNNGRGATLCHKCSVIITTGLTEELYCEKCKSEQENKMKNIHILPTDEPSRLIINWEKDLCYKSKPYLMEGTQNIYITSDEFIDNDWVLNTIIGKVFFNNTKLDLVLPVTKKIILTTDPKLIENGVQAINDEFLEWFVENTSCEEVKTIKVPYFDESGYSHLLIIPKEEQTKCYCGHTTTCDCGPEDPKEETLEETAERFVNSTRLKNPKSIFIEGAKWKQERSYSEAIDLFITEIKTEFKDDSWDYLEFIKERVVQTI